LQLSQLFDFFNLSLEKIIFLKSDIIVGQIDVKKT